MNFETFPFVFIWPLVPYGIGVSTLRSYMSFSFTVRLQCGRKPLLFLIFSLMLSIILPSSPSDDN